MEGQQIPRVFSAAAAGLSHALGLSKGSRENGGQGESSLASLNWRFLEGNRTLVPFDCCEGYILVAPDFGSILLSLMCWVLCKHSQGSQQVKKLR